MADRVEMLSGTSSTQLDRLFAVPFVATLLGAELFPLSSILDDRFGIQVPSGLLTVAAVLALTCAIPTIVLLVMLLRRRATEERAGYTLHSRRRQDLPQLDPNTGAVIRVAGEPYPSFAELRRRMVAARESD